MKKIYILLLLFFSIQVIYGHPWKPAHYVIIDTDGGVDDLKAINMLLASSDVRVLAIIASGGAADPSTAYIKVKSLLNSFHHEGLRVGINYNIDGERFDLPMVLEWGDETGITQPANSNFTEVVRSAMEVETMPVKLVSLGSLNSASKLIEEGISFAAIYWSVGSIDPPGGMNYDLDRESADKVLAGSLPVYCVGYTSGSDLYSEELVAGIEKIERRYAKSFSSLFMNNALTGHQFIYGGNDDLIPLFMHYPELFTTTKKGKNSFSLPSQSSNLKNAIETILKGETVNMNQVVRAFPADSSFYQSDIQPYVSEIITSHGIEEWSSGVLANELHRHLGIFAIVGVKMGTRAREYFHIGVDEMELVSYAGSTPPLSCMNDGLQVSTGGTPGHGLLTVNNERPFPVVDFKYRERTLRISLKQDLAEKISGELKEINYVNGLDSNIYWELVRQKSILYWKNLNRHDIFDITEIQ